jgi:hypothetical protein
VTPAQDKVQPVEDIRISHQKSVVRGQGRGRSQLSNS